MFSRSSMIDMDEGGRIALFHHDRTLWRGKMESPMRMMRSAGISISRDDDDDDDDTLLL
jgi:hypothetical protein